MVVVVVVVVVVVAQGFLAPVAMPIKKKSGTCPNHHLHLPNMNMYLWHQTKKIMNSRNISGMFVFRKEKQSDTR